MTSAKFSAAGTDRTDGSLVLSSSRWGFADASGRDARAIKPFLHSYASSKVSSFVGNVDAPLTDPGTHLYVVRAMQALGARCFSALHGVLAARSVHPPRAYLLFDSVQSFQASFAPHAQESMEDIPKYTNSQPLLQTKTVWYRTLAR